jgi:hypothetical protein
MYMGQLLRNPDCAESVSNPAETGDPPISAEQVGSQTASLPSHRHSGPQVMANGYSLQSLSLLSIMLGAQ